MKALTILIAFAPLFLYFQSPPSRRGSDWPVYRHDTTLTGVSSGKGKIHDPKILWQHYLGAPFVELASTSGVDPWKTDLDGDGSDERVTVTGKTVRVSSLSGDVLCSFTINADASPGLVRICKMFPDRNDKQIIVFTSRMDSGDGQGYCFAFDKGVRNGRLLWSTPPLTGQHAPTMVVDDVDGDGLPEIVTAPHYRVEIFSGQTGKLKAEVPWDVGRNYGILLTRPRKDRPQKDIFIVCDFVLHVDCIRYQDGKWVHAWGHKYVEPNVPTPRGREMYIRVGPNPVTDLDGDGKDEMVYMLIDAAADDQWHLRVRDCETGRVRSDIAGVWLWSIADLDGDGINEIAYTPSGQKRPSTRCDVHIGRLAGDRISDLAVLSSIGPILSNARFPLTAHSIADDGLSDLMRVNINPDRGSAIFYATGGTEATDAVDDHLQAASLNASGKLETVWSFSRPGHRLNLVFAGTNSQGAIDIRVRDLTDYRLLSIDKDAQIRSEVDLGKPGGFSTTPVVADLDGDSVNEIVVQSADGKIVSLHPGKLPSDPPAILWSARGVAMNYSPGYLRNGALCPQIADLDGDGLSEVLFATENEDGLCAITCVDSSGKQKWKKGIEGCAWGGLQAGVDSWTFGRFTDRSLKDGGLDVYVDLHRRSKGSGEGWVLRGDTGEVIWSRQGLISKETAMPFGNGVPAVADMNNDGFDDLVQEFYVVYGVISGATGEPVFPPAFLPGPDYFGKWIAYSSPTIADLDGDGSLDVYLNSASYARGGYAAVRADGRPMWVEFHDNLEGSDGFGPVGDLDGDGHIDIAVPVLNGTLVCLDARTGARKWVAKAPVWGDVVAADINSDGVMELVFSGRDGQLRALSGKDGHELWSFRASGRAIIADANGDGLVEIIIVGGDGVLRVIG